jgi:hypothetical protein
MLVVRHKCASRICTTKACLGNGCLTLRCTRRATAGFACFRPRVNSNVRGLVDTGLVTVTSSLLTATFWLGVPCILLALFLGLGFRSRGRLTALLSLGGAIGLASWALALSLEGLVTGEAMTISRHWGTVQRSEQPIYFWVATGFWFVLSFALVVGMAWAVARKFKSHSSWLR